MSGGSAGVGVGPALPLPDYEADESGKHQQLHGEFPEGSVPNFARPLRVRPFARHVIVERDEMSQGGPSGKDETRRCEPIAG